ncbi:hypothetical protein COOONC_04026 [Cooperia oncophora]
MYVWKKTISCSFTVVFAIIFNGLPYQPENSGLCDDATKLCGSLEAQTSCGQCIKQHPDCAWCRDPPENSGLCDDATKLCGSLEAQTSCGQCIKQHPDCAWCRDPVTLFYGRPWMREMSADHGATRSTPCSWYIFQHSTEQNRCKVRSAFKTETCNPSYVYSPATEIRIGPHVSFPWNICYFYVCF